MVTHAKKERFKLCKLHSNCISLREAENSHSQIKIVNIFCSFTPEPCLFLFSQKNTQLTDRSCYLIKNTYLQMLENVDKPLLTCPIRILWGCHRPRFLASMLGNELEFFLIVFRYRAVSPRLANTKRNEPPITRVHRFGDVTNYAYNRRRYGSLNIRNLRDSNVGGQHYGITKPWQPFPNKYEPIPKGCREVP